jgi:hypothetical protein
VGDPSAGGVQHHGLALLADLVVRRTGTNF